MTRPECDPLLASVPLPHEAEYYPHGFPVRIRTNSQEVLNAACESWGGLEQNYAEAPLEIRCLVRQGGHNQRAPRLPVVRAQGPLLVSVADHENYYTCDLARGFAFGWVNASTVAATEPFRYHFLEAMVYCLLDTRHLVAVHAACVSLDGCGILLAGDSGAGKSSLAYACARRGFTYTSDDSSSLVRKGEGRRVLGNPRLFRFRESAGTLFPEFSGRSARRRGNGKPTVEIATASLPAIRTAAEVDVEHVVFLRRGAASLAPELISVALPDARMRLSFNPWPSELPMQQDRQATFDRLLGAQLHELRYRDLDTAVDRLEQLVRGGPR